ncbi:sensor histidine kinase [Streptomyces endophyticus]|uniref:Sensor histidine kinase n=1 Tax=Streptomyces endophyticus TaxID=714166 RepID=A0ABU6EXH1_9ACTN|nr:sensor histidine kinase [Streptomyces endophyticus]MEB8336397.1 sensor histidine kinase [Streptomyces endophyticus]
MSTERDGQDGVPKIGQPAESRRETLLKLLWIGMWLAFLGSPVVDLVQGDYGPTGTVLGALGLVAFVGCYVVLVMRRMARPVGRLAAHAALAVLPVLAVTLCLTLGADWLVLFVYISVACGAVLPLRWTRLAILATTAVMVGVGLLLDTEPQYWLLVPALLAGFSMIGVRELVRTTSELREARAQVAQLAANEERLRLARDLHDLLGHSLSLITLKSELAGRMLPDHPDKAAGQVADIEKVSRQALVDVREAVSGYRRARLATELAGAGAALTAAGVTADVPSEAPELPEAQESALAWTLREAVTNVVRHSGARRCVVDVTRRETLEGPRVELTVEDDGSGPSGAPPGNGLTGLAERLTAADGTLETGAARGGGFRLVARVPASVGSAA